MGHIDNEPSTPQRSISSIVESIPAASDSRPNLPGSESRIQDNMDIKPRFDGMRFDSQIFDLYIGSEKRHFAVHRAVLNQSPRFKTLCNIQAQSKTGGAKAKTTMYFELDSPQGMGHLLEYLYTNRFVIRGAEPLDEAKQLVDLYLLASHYTLPGLQEAVMRQLESAHISSKITAMHFFNMAEDLYGVEPHPVMREYFRKVAPGLLKTVAEGELEELLRMISEGGDFATDLFAAHHQAFGPGHMAASHPESESQEGPLPKKLKTEESSALPVNVRTTWDDENEIPSFWHEMSEADKMLVTMREEGKSWNEIDQALEKKHGKNGSISEWLNRYGRISIIMAHMRLKKGDVDRLFMAKEQADKQYDTEKWSFIADSMEKNGAERYRPDFLKKKFKDLELALRARDQNKVVSTDNTPASVRRTVSGNENSTTKDAVNGAKATPAKETLNNSTDSAMHKTIDTSTEKASVNARQAATSHALPTVQKEAGSNTAVESLADKLPTEGKVISRTKGGALKRATIPAVIAQHKFLKRGANAEASNECPDTPITETTPKLAPTESKKRPNSAIHDLLNAEAPQPKKAPTFKNPPEAKAEDLSKPPSARKAADLKAFASPKAGASAVNGGPNTKVADSDYVAHDDDGDYEESSMSEDDLLL